MKDLDETKPKVKIDIENVVRHLFAAYPNVNYIALNCGLSMLNEKIWDNRWYFVGFIDKPAYQPLDKYHMSWVANKSVKSFDEEVGVFFMHILSDDHYLKDEPLQTSKTDFISVDRLCWHRLGDNDIENLVPETTGDKKFEKDKSDFYFDARKAVIMPSMNHIVKNPK